MIYLSELSELQITKNNTHTPITRCVHGYYKNNILYHIPSAVMTGIFFVLARKEVLAFVLFYAMAFKVIDYLVKK